MVSSSTLRLLDGGGTHPSRAMALKGTWPPDELLDINVLKHTHTHKITAQPEKVLWMSHDIFLGSAAGPSYAGHLDIRAGSHQFEDGGHEGL